MESTLIYIYICFKFIASYLKVISGYVEVQ